MTTIQKFQNETEEREVLFEGKKIKQKYAVDYPLLSTKQNIIVLSDKQIETLLTTSPIDVFKRELDNVSETQVRGVINYAILHKLMDMNKIDYLEKRVPGTDILHAISMEKQIEKAEAAER